MRRFISAVALPLMLLLTASGMARAQEKGIVQRLNRLQDDVLAANSATQLLTARCAELHLADPAVVTAAQAKGATGMPTADIRAKLKVNKAEPLRYRRVLLMCGGRVLSAADNWYVPSRLTPEMNTALDNTDTPFGTVVKPLNFHRRTVEMARPMSDDALIRADNRLWEWQRLKTQTVFQVEAVLLTPQENPISLVIENYAGTLLDEPKP